MSEAFHRPVMVQEVLDLLGDLGDGVFVDATVGGGGHSLAVLDRWTGLRAVVMDRDPDALEEAARTLGCYGDRVTMRQARFSCLERILGDLGLEGAHGILMDLGVSSHQLDQPERGFTYRGERLDMRMDPEDSIDAVTLLNTWPEADIARALRQYGEERWAPRIARFITKRRPLKTAGELVEVIKDAIPAKFRRTGPHPARRTFQALRIAVNREMEELQEGLAAAARACLPGGRVVVLCYHSLEDRMVKSSFREWSQSGCFRVLTPRPLRPEPAEVEANPRSRSARLRAAQRVSGIGASGREYT
ncbi:MAG: 16S rRNA (cytosine(1402)-N(4))-methyltransferase RsmH [Bacillota bacterium]|jgi:16S rRNA (cytosine1402-N4)-methyltransferase